MFPAKMHCGSLSVGKSTMSVHNCIKTHVGTITDESNIGVRQLSAVLSASLPCVSMTALSIIFFVVFGALLLNKTLANVFFSHVFQVYKRVVG